MAEVPVEFSGMAYDLLNRTSTRVYLMGKMNIYGLSVGGGPIVPPDQVPPDPGQPGKPTFPIWGPPGIELPPSPGYPPVAGHPLPPLPDNPPELPAGTPPN